MAINKVLFGNSTLIDITDTTAEATNVQSGKQFHDKTGELVTGTMIDRGAVNKVLTTARDEDVYTVPSGYHNGSGVVRIYPEIKSGIIPTKSQQNIYPSTGSVLSLVTISAIPSAYQDVTGVTATASEVLASKVFVNSSGTEITGTMINWNGLGTTLDATTGKQSMTIPSGYHNGLGAVNIVLEEKTATPSESAQVIQPTNGKVLSKVSIGAISSNYIGSNITQRSATDLSASGSVVSVPSGYYAATASKAISAGSATTPATTISVTPSVSLNSATGVITVTAAGSSSITPSISAGYVSTGVAGAVSVNGSNTYSLTSKSAQTYTPGTADITIAAGQYLTGAQTIAGDTNLVAENIVENVTIFGVTGSLALPSVSGEILILTGSVDGTVLSL